jgi:uncharacterized membrane protein
MRSTRSEPVSGWFRTSGRHGSERRASRRHEPGRPERGRPRSGRLVHLLFLVGVVGKGIDGALEIAGGVLLFFLDPVQIHGIVRLLTQHELSEDPKDLVANYLLHRTGHVSAGTRTFGAIYLLSHGLVKSVLVTGLLSKQRWAYPAAIFAFLLFVVYQLYRYTHTGSPELVVLSILDVLVVVLTWLEYEQLRAVHVL